MHSRRVCADFYQIVMRLSRPDENDSSKRRHFEISIDSPFNILSCRATQANVSLPAYSAGGNNGPSADEYTCGCPGASVIARRNTPPSGPQHPAALAINTNVPNASLPNPGVSRSWTNDDGGLAMPTRAHVHNDPNDPNTGNPRPIHLLRVPSFNPPAFEDEEPPPPLITPPPQYDYPDSRNTLADYFARLADETADDEEHDRSRVDVPLTPGGRINRSMDISRTWAPLGGPSHHAATTTTVNQ